MTVKYLDKALRPNMLEPDNDVWKLAGYDVPVWVAMIIFGKLDMLVLFLLYRSCTTVRRIIKGCCGSLQTFALGQKWSVVNVSISSIIVDVELAPSHDQLQQADLPYGAIWLCIKKLTDKGVQVCYREYTFDQDKVRGISVFAAYYSYAVGSIGCTKEKMQTHIQNLTDCVDVHTHDTKVKRLVEYVAKCINQHKHICPKEYAKFACMQRDNINPFYRFDDFTNRASVDRYLYPIFHDLSDIPKEQQTPDTSWLECFVKDLHLVLVRAKDVVKKWGGNYPLFKKPRTR